MFCGKAFQILGPNVARLLWQFARLFCGTPKVADLQVFTKIPLGLTLASSFA